VLRSYLPALVFLAIGGILALVFTYANTLLGPTPRKTVKATYEPYESGLPSEVKRTFRFGISFYMIAMLFLLFDVEVIFLFPVAVKLREFGTFAMYEAITFIGLLAVAFVYVWRRGALSWR
jgi:NADH:ubiquinone oxidoreductase subunit 3 (chain A)